MSDHPRLVTITPTVLLTGQPGALRQEVRVTVANPGPATTVALRLRSPDGEAAAELALPAGVESTHAVELPELTAPASVTASLARGTTEVDRQVVAWQPPPHLRVHVVQHSHHDVGYTNLASTVRREHVEFLNEALDLAAATTDDAEDARFRIVIEQAWSLQEFVRCAPAARVEQMGALLRRGDFELTALCGNLTTELCSSEELLRALYPARELARRFGCAVTTAEHNDVPGLSWGLAQALTEAGIRLFCPQLPRYWSWCDPPLQTFWDEAVLFPQGRPGAFWWSAPTGRRVLLWDSYGSGGDVRPDLPELAERLGALVARGYPYQSVYWPVRGGRRDNSPYIGGFCDTIQAWNARWTFPRLLSSTNARFHEELQPELPADLPVAAGELPGQDYPVGAMSTAAATAVNRGAHTQLVVAERLAALSAAVTDHLVPTADLAAAWADVLWSDEHTWGHHFPAGPTAAAAELEKQVHAYRAAAVAHDVTAQALARLADHVELPGEGLYLVVFNPLAAPRTAAVVTPLRELENAGSRMVLVTEPAHPEQPGHLRGVPLTDRWHLHPPPDIVAGRFDLVDVASGQTVPHQLTPVEADAAVPYAPQRHGLAQGGRRYGFFEIPSGLGWDLRFVARDLPACGYRTYELRPRPDLPPGPAGGVGLRIENEYYRVEADPDTGRITSLRDLETDRELLDAQAPHGLGELVVRSPETVLPGSPTTWRRGAEGPVYRSLEGTAAAPGHPAVRLTLALHQGVKRVELALRVLKDPTPLLDVHVAFPFLVADPEFRHDGGLAVETPLTDYLPGAYWDEVAVQHWVRVAGVGQALLWSSLDSPVVALGGLTAGYTSPAHSCQVPDRLPHAPGDAAQLAHGWLYSLLGANNFGTNFAVSQTGSLLYRYSLTTAAGELSDADSVRLGGEAVTPCETIFTTPRRRGHLPLVAGWLALAGSPLTLLAAKRAEDGDGLVLRFWNPAAEIADTRIDLACGAVVSARLTTVTEDAPAAAGAELLAVDEQGCRLRVEPRGLATVRLILTKVQP